MLIMDEPTSSLSPREAEKLATVVMDLRERQVSILYISHRLGEVEELADRVIGLRDGKPSGELVGDAVSRESMVRLMVGRLIQSREREVRVEKGPMRLLVQGPGDVDFSE